MQKVLLYAGIAVLIIVAAVSVWLLFFSRSGEPLSDEKCAQYTRFRVSDTEFGRTRTEFSTGSDLFPEVTIDKGSRECGKPIAVTLYDAGGNIVLAHAYNSPPQGNGGTTGYGNYNPGHALWAGNYTFECSYGDAIIGRLLIRLK